MSHRDPHAIRAVNRQIAALNEQLGATHPHAVPGPDATDVVGVHDIETESFHWILVHRLDYRPRPAAPLGNVVVFSRPRYAPHKTKKLQLATPAYYRDREDLAPGIHDPHDGTLTRNADRWAKAVIGETASARVSFASSGEPWVYCASHYRTDRELGRLRGDFRIRYGYSAAALIDDPDAFAVWLGVDFALALDKTADINLGPIDEIVYARSRYNTNLWDGSGPIETLAHVYHGPVRYQDITGRLDTQQQWFDPNAGPKAWFTKKSSFSDQSEYRFAVTTCGVPVRPKHYIAVSPELRQLASAL